MNAPPESEIADDSSYNSFVLGVTTNDFDSELPTEEEDAEQSRVYRVLLSISSLAVPLLIVTFLLFPAAVVVLMLLTICVVPAILILCLGFVLYLCAPETSSTFALLWGTNGGGDHATRRWDMDWTLASYMEAAAGGGAQEPRSRDDLEKLLILKTVVADVADAGHDEEEKRRSEDAKLQDVEENIEEEKVEDEQSHKQEENTDSSNIRESEKRTQLHGVNCIACVEDDDSDEQDVETGHIPVDSKIDSNPYLTIRLSKIEKSCCDICMMDYELGDVVSQSNNSNCDHIFHKDCILDWMQKKHSCPCCRRNYLGEEDCDGLPIPMQNRWAESP